MNKRSEYIPLERGLAERIIANIVIDFPWLVDTNPDGAIDSEEVLDLGDRLIDDIRKLSERGENSAKRLMVLFRDRAEFGPKPKGFWKEDK